jgi:hypothetical protein
MKKLIAILIAFFILPISIAKADNTPSFHGVRPHVGEINDNKLVVSIPLIPLIGSTNFLQFGGIKELFTNAMGLSIPSEGTEFERLQGFIDTINNFHGKDINLFLYVLPSLKVEVNTKYFEFKVFGGAQSYASAKVHGLSKKLSITDIGLDQNMQPQITGLNQKVLELRNVNLFGGEAWAIGKVPIKIKDYRLTVLFGVGTAIAYRLSYSYDVSLEDTVNVSNGFTAEGGKETALLWNVNAMAGLQFDGFKWLRPRLVVQVRDIYNGCDKRSQAKVDLGLDVSIGKRFGVHAELYNMADPQFRMEGSFSFLNNSEVAVGGMFNSEYPGRHYGYAVLGLGGKVIKWTLMMMYSKDSIGAFTGLTIGWMP